MSPGTQVAVIVIAGIAGLVRGTTGFGGAMVMSPPLALLLGPRLTVPVVLIMESFVAVPMLLQTRHLINWRMIGIILAAACFTVPIGALILTHAEPQLLRRVIAINVIVFSLLLLIGWRYAGRPRVVTSVGLGALSGAMMGATSIGAPPVILYLLSGEDPIATTRANLNVYVTIGSVISLVALWYQGIVDAQVGWTTLWLGPAYFAGLLVGVRLFRRLSDTRFRQLTLVLLICVSIGILLA
ncbi:MAG TPA: sulfite exporter TauE/SafE family protein [Casimicrobiaceae bacterium]|nr:sulfite exporter TauE/SafE family protein [Casimicrobiaceae bacterium]